jgi:hypothetical protein
MYGKMDRSGLPEDPSRCHFQKTGRSVTDCVEPAINLELLLAKFASRPWSEIQSAMKR